MKKTILTAVAMAASAMALSAPASAWSTSTSDTSFVLENARALQAERDAAAAAVVAHQNQVRNDAFNIIAIGIGNPSRAAAMAEERGFSIENLNDFARVYGGNEGILGGHHITGFGNTGTMFTNLRDQYR